MRISAKTKPAKPVVEEVAITLSAADASKLRRMCYYNQTIARKFAGNPNGGRRKADDLLAFATNLGNSLKRQGVDRF